MEKFPTLGIKKIWKIFDYDLVFLSQSKINYENGIIIAWNVKVSIYKWAYCI